MSTAPTFRQWLDPQHDVVPAAVWGVLLDRSEIAAMQLALQCARRGDAASLAVLCDVASEREPGELLKRFGSAKLTEQVPMYEIIDSGDWDDPAQAHKVVPMTTVTWDDCSWEKLMALCLSRPVREGKPVQPRTLAQDQAKAEAGFLPEYQGELVAQQQVLLKAAMGLFGKLPAEQHRAGGLELLFQFVTEKVASPGVVQGFKDAGVRLEDVFGKSASDGALNTQLGTLAGHALACGNPVGAQAILQAARSVTDMDSDEVRQAVHDSMTMIGSPSAHLRFQGVAGVLRRMVGDDALPMDPRFQALVDVCQHACSDSRASVRIERCMKLLSAHIDHQCNDRSGPALPTMWCDPLVRACMQPVCDIAPEVLVQEVRSLFEEAPKGARNMFRGMLSTACVPAFEAVKPVLPMLISHHCWEHETMSTGWYHFAGKPGFANVDLGSWKRAVCVLVEAGVDPGGVISERLPDGTACQTTPLHVVAQGGGDEVVERMAFLVEQGADSQATDAQRRTPAHLMRSAQHRARWEDFCLSLQARRAAGEVLDLPGLRNA